MLVANFRLTKTLTPAEIAKLSPEEVDLPVTWQDLQEAFGDTNPSVSEVSIAIVFYSKRLTLKSARIVVEPCPIVILVETSHSRDYTLFVENYISPVDSKNLGNQTEIQRRESGQIVPRSGGELWTRLDI